MTRLERLPAERRRHTGPNQHASYTITSARAESEHAPLPCLSIPSQMKRIETAAWSLSCPEITFSSIPGERDAGRLLACCRNSLAAVWDRAFRRGLKTLSETRAFETAQIGAKSARLSAPMSTRSVK
jgi:hypothetical protein